MQRTWFNTLVRVNLQVGGGGGSNEGGIWGLSVGVGGSSCADTNELVSVRGEKGWLFSPCFGEGQGSPDLGMSFPLSVVGGDDSCPIILNNELFGLENLTF